MVAQVPIGTERFDPGWLDEVRFLRYDQLSLYSVMAAQGTLNPLVLVQAQVEPPNMAINVQGATCSAVNREEIGSIPILPASYSSRSGIRGVSKTFQWSSILWWVANYAIKLTGLVLGLPSHREQGSIPSSRSNLS